MRQWRLILNNPMNGAFNMAADEAILCSVAAGDSLPTLRLYRWLPLCLSLGYGQRVRDADLARVQERGWGMVRRPTGGKAILHGDEITYSVSLPQGHPLTEGDIVESYRRISLALIAALQTLGLSPQSEQQAKGNKGLGPVCFEVPSHYEITAGGKKLIGSAQVRRKIGVLQHGSLPLCGDIARICDALAYPDDISREQAKISVRERATTLEAVTGQVIHWQRAADAIVQGFAETFDIAFTVGTLTAAEAEHTAQLIAETYANPEWTNKR